jgi:hypothetical protein
MTSQSLLLPITTPTTGATSLIECSRKMARPSKRDLQNATLLTLTVLTPLSDTSE